MDDANQFTAYADRWALAWSERDLERILSAFAEDVQFRSPVAARLTGQPVVQGKAALRTYWERALAQYETINFQVERTVFDAQQRTGVIVYNALLNGELRRSAEQLTFNASGLITSAEAFHGA